MMASQDQISEALCGFIRDQIAPDEIAVSPGLSFEAMGLDSFSLIELVLFLERQYGITLPDHELNSNVMQNAHTLAACAAKYLPA